MSKVIIVDSSGCETEWKVDNQRTLDTIVFILEKICERTTKKPKKSFLQRLFKK